MSIPVLITVFNRYDHFVNCVKSLENCYNSNDVHLFVASDYSSDSQNIKKIKKIRSFIRNFSGFKKITIFQRTKNIGVLENYYDSLKRVFKTYDFLIFLQDDIVVGKSFLNYMSSGLNFYKNHANVISICSFIPYYVENISRNNFFLQRRSPYGIGIWKKKEIDFEKKGGKAIAKKILNSKKLFKIIAKDSPHIIRSFPFIANDDFRAGDYEAAAIMKVSNLYALYPHTSLSFNSGVDGSGIHSGINKNLLINKNIDKEICLNFLKNVKENKKIANLISTFHSSIKLNIINNIIFFGWNYVPGFYLVLKIFKFINIKTKKIYYKLRYK